MSTTGIDTAPAVAVAAPAAGLSVEDEGKLRFLASGTSFNMLRKALEDRRTALATRILESDVPIDVDARNDDLGETLLHAAAAAGNVECVRQLLRRGASCSAVDASGATPLHAAADEGHADVIAELLDASAVDVNATDNFQNTPLHRAAGEGHRDAVKTLVKHAANIRAVNEDHLTPLHKAAVVPGVAGVCCEREREREREMCCCQIAPTVLRRWCDCAPTTGSRRCRQRRRRARHDAAHARC
jgi:hypothetical protein